MLRRFRHVVAEIEEGSLADVSLFAGHFWSWLAAFGYNVPVLIDPDDNVLAGLGCRHLG